MGSCEIPLLLSTLFVTVAAVIAAPIEAKPLELPNNVKADSEILYISPQVAQMYLVEEFVDRADGSIKLIVSNLTESDKRGADEMTYYRIKEGPGLEASRSGDYDSRIVHFSKSTQLCNVDYLSTWYLWGVSHILGLLEASSSALNTTSLRTDRTAIGPLALIQLIHDNLDQFRLDSMAFDKINLYDMYYFSTSLELGQQQVAKFICTIPVHHVDPANSGVGSPLRVGKSLLSELTSVSGHISRVGVVVFDAKSQLGVKQLDSMEAASLLADPQDSSPYHTKLIVSYTLVQERSSSKQAGTSWDESVDLVHPFSLPTGAGCGLVSQHSPFYVLSKQFSGHFEALEFKDRFFMAYDQATNHLRYDSLGEHRTIYSLHDKRAIMISAAGGNGSLNRTNTKTPDAKDDANDDDDYEPDRNHCVQGYFSSHDSLAAEGYLFEQSNSLGDILGVGEEAGLFYLGPTKLRDDQFDDRVYHVFERELASGAHLPAILRMHLRLEARANNRYFAVYYFVNEQLAGTLDDLFANPEAYKWMRLKRVELSSMNRMLKYKLLNSRLTFSQFSWSLESPSPGPVAMNDFAIGSTANMFDTLECKSISDQLQLEFVLEQLNLESDWLSTSSGHASGGRQSHDLSSSWSSSYDFFGNQGQQQVAADNEFTLALEDQLASVEETLIKFINRRTELARMFINDFHLSLIGREPLPAADPSYKSSDGVNSYDFLVKAKLTSPLNFKYTTKYVGWLKEADPVLTKKRATLIKHKELMPRHECVLRLASRFHSGLANNARPMVYMMYCPNLGCGHLNVWHHSDSDNSSNNGSSSSLADYELEDTSYMLKMDVYVHSCEVHELRREYDPIKTNIINNIYLPDQIRKSLNRASLTIKLMVSDAETEDNQGRPHSHPLPQDAIKVKSFRGIVSKLSLVNGLHHDYWDEQLMSNYCYTERTSLNYNNNSSSNNTDGQQAGLQQQQKSIKLIQLELDRHHSRYHCHKACQLYPFCDTYTYNRATRACSLSNISRQLIRDMEDTNHDSAPMIHRLENVEQAPECGLFALNPVLLYQPKDQIRFDSPRRLLEGDKYLLEASLRDCAALCHANELNLIHNTNTTTNASSSLANSNSNRNRNHCRAFKYLKVESLCSLEASNYNYYYGHEQGVELQVGPSGRQGYLASEQQLASIVDDIDRVYKIEWFQRDYEQYYELKRATRLDLNEPVAGNPLASAATGRILPILYDVEQDICLRECTVVRPDCVAVDYCRLLDKSAGLSRSCRMYTIRSPFTVVSAHENQARGLVEKLAADELQLESGAGVGGLTDIERKFYIHRDVEKTQMGSSHAMGNDEDEIDGYNITIKHENCQHFYLEGDNLYLKRLLVSSESKQQQQLAGNSGWSEDASVKQIQQLDQSWSEQYLKQIEAATMGLFKSNEANELGGHLFSLWPQLLLGGLGLVLGSLVYIIQPKLAAGLVAAASSSSSSSSKHRDQPAPDGGSSIKAGLGRLGGLFGSRWTEYCRNQIRWLYGGRPGTRAGGARSLSQVELNEMTDIGIYDTH